MNGTGQSIAVFAKRVVRFDPERVPIITFGSEGSLDNLIQTVRSVGYMVLVGTMDEVTLKMERGCLLGMAEFLPVRIESTDLIGCVDLHRDEIDGGRPIWRNAVPITRAWRFDPRFKLLDVLEEPLTFEATSRAVPLNGNDVKTVLALTRKEVAVAPLPNSTDGSLQQQPSTGPVPTPWSGIIAQSTKPEASVYVLQFGKRSLWKIGFTSDLDRRLAEINQHVPFEELGEQWRIVLRHHAASPLDAYALEQGVLSALTKQRSVGERVRCTEEQLRAAWAAGMEFAPIRGRTDGWST